MAIEINGIHYEPSAAERELMLVDYLRDVLGLTGTKIGCRIGACGCCVVHVDDKPVRSCRRKVSSLEGARVRTIEGLRASDGKLHPVQQAFVDAGAIQCGYCTPGMVMSSVALLAQQPKPSRDEIRRALSRNLCRCTGYKQIIDAVELAAGRREEP